MNSRLTAGRRRQVKQYSMAYPFLELTSGFAAESLEPPTKAHPLCGDLAIGGNGLESSQAEGV
jgi:hypothetical protein